MLNKALSESINKAYNEKQPFLIYAIPHEGVMAVSLDFHQVNTPGTTDNEHFTISTFNGEETCNFKIGNPKTYVLPQRTLTPGTSLTTGDGDRMRYISLVNKAKGAVLDGTLEKVVLSRAVEISLKDFSPNELMLSLFSAYPDTFRYIWFHPDHGIWAGASPEILLKVDSGEMETMSLAGTRLISELDTNPFGDKEKEEQQLVTNMITDSLRPYSSEMHIGNIEKRKAGELVHLQTRIKVSLLPDSAINEVTNSLHPTPAVCGLPRYAALRFIKQYEGYDRKFYTGYVGLHNPRQQSAAYFVNLRCMHIADNKATLFAGGGITGKSETESEWQETQNKLRTMLKVLAPFL